MDDHESVTDTPAVGFVVYKDDDDRDDMVPLADEDGRCRLFARYKEARQEQDWLDVVSAVSAARYQELRRTDAAAQRQRKWRRRVKTAKPTGPVAFVAQVGRAVSVISRRERSEPGFVYLIRGVGVDGVFKIGKSADPEQRRREHQPSSPVELVIEFVIPAERMGRLEAELKARFADQHLHHEWYRLSDEDVVWIRSLGADIAAGAAPPEETD